MREEAFGTRKQELGEGSKGGLGWEKQGVWQEGGRGEPSGTLFPSDPGELWVSGGSACRAVPAGHDGAKGRARPEPRPYGSPCGAVMVVGGFYCFEHSKALLSDEMPFLRS